MAFRVARMARTKSGACKARKGIPADIRDEYAALHGRRWEELFRAPPDVPPQRAKVLRATWEAEIETRIATLRAKKRGEGHDLTQRQAHALAGEWYRWYTSQHEEDPGAAGQWAKLREVLWLLLEDAAGDPETHQIDLEAPEVRAEIHPKLADEAKTAQFLASKGEVLTPSAMTLFLDAVLYEFLEATTLLERRASRDYSPDKHLQTLPEYRKAPPLVQGSGKTCVELFRAYVAAVKPRPSTIRGQLVVFTTLDKYLDGRNVQDMSADEAQRWIASLVTAERSPVRVRRTYIAALRAVLNWALLQKLVIANPFAGVSITIPRKVLTRDRAFTEAEQQTILKAALAITDSTNNTKSPFKAACRWVPWLCAYSGARGGEMTQLRGQDIKPRGDFFVIEITPAAGTVKGSIPRTVPIHEHVIAQGFIDYVRSRGNGPLFYDPSPKKDATDTQVPPDIIRPKREPYTKVREKLAAWVRKIGVTDPGVQPLHGWRHTFQQIAARYMTERIYDEITGHTPLSVGRGYGRPTVEDMEGALNKFPRYKLDRASPNKPQGSPRARITPSNHQSSMAPLARAIVA
jgi:integrase